MCCARLGATVGRGAATSGSYPDGVRRPTFDSAAHTLGLRVRPPPTNNSNIALTLLTNTGPLDLCFTPAAFPDGYEELHANAVKVEVGPGGVRIAALADVVASKRAAGRPKDIVALPLLEARLRELD